jgi:transcriptional regulator with XRE-family HTH domain
MSSTQADFERDLQRRIRVTAGELIAQRIREARGEESHDKLGARLGGVSRQHLIRLEKGDNRPRARLLAKIAEATSRDVDWFLAPEVDQTPSRFPEVAA